MKKIIKNIYYYIRRNYYLIFRKSICCTIIMQQEYFKVDTVIKTAANKTYLYLGKNKYKELQSK